MKSKLTLTAKIFNPGVHTTQAGAKLYSFSMGISQVNKQTEKWENVYLPVTIFSKEGDLDWILQSDKKEITIEGQLSVKSGYTKRDGTEVAPHIAVFGFEAYIGKKPQQKSHENTTQATKQVQDTQSHPNNAYSQGQPNQAPPTQPNGGYQADFPIADSEIPFGYIGLSEGGYYVHLI